jgi:predicted choloylglycine hydrolase
MKHNFFPLFQIEAKTHFEFGERIGQAAKIQIQQGLIRRKKWLAGLKRFVDCDKAGRAAPFIKSLDLHFPEYLEELVGMARGAEVDFDLLFLLNLNPELSAFMLRAKEENCSTVMAVQNGRIILAHNEDGSEHYLGLMFLLKAGLPSGNECLALCYPGIIPGNGPSINSSGVVHTCNYIGGRDCQTGVPRYFIDRALLDARSLDEAIALCSHNFRAYSEAHNLVSIAEQRAVMVESSARKVLVREVNGVIARTNHFIFPEMQKDPEFASYIKRSAPRLEALKAALDKFQGRQISTESIRRSLSSHLRKPLSPCRHKHKKVRGATLGMFLFDSATAGVRFYFGPPCRNIFRKFQPDWER